MTVSTQAIPPQRDFQGCFLRESLWLQYDFFAFKTLERAYLLKLDNKIAERPQHMIMRGASTFKPLSRRRQAQAISQKHPEMRLWQRQLGPVFTSLASARYRVVLFSRVRHPRW